MALPSDSVDVDEALLVLENKLRTLERFVLKQKGLNSLPEMPRPRLFRSVRAMYNAVDSSIVQLEKISSKMPRAGQLEGRSHIHAKEIDYDPGDRFSQLMDPLFAQLAKAGREIGLLEKDFGPPAVVIKKQTEAFGKALKGTAELISKASTMAKPANPAALRKECESLVDSSQAASDYRHDVTVRSPLHNHALALSDAAAALGWVVSPIAQKHVREFKQIVAGSTENILASYIDLGLNPTHSDFAEAVNSIMTSLVDYVVREHPAGLRWNYAKGSTPKGYRRAARNLSENSHPFGDYDGFLNGPIAAYYSTSSVIGGEVFKQAEAVRAAFLSMGEVIEKCSNRLRPVGNGDAELKMILRPVVHDLVAVVNIAKKCPEDYTFKSHLDAVVEFVSSMQWCTASVHKMSPVSYIKDIEGLTTLYLDAIANEFGRGESYKAKAHREWVQNVKDMLKELIQYVRNHHPYELMFDTRRSRKSVDSIFERTRLTKKIEELKKKSTSRRWELRSKLKTVKGQRKRVRAWQRVR